MSAGSGSFCAEQTRDLIANEFVTNSLMHAFGEEGGTISVSVEATGDRLHLCFRDSGKGLPSVPQTAPSDSGTGMKLIEALARHLGTEPAWPASETGTMLRLDLERERD